MFPQVKEQPVFFGRKNYQMTEDYKAIVNPETNNLYSIVSSKYKLIKHEEVISGVEEALWEVPEYGQTDRRVELTNDGSKMRTTFKFPEISVNVGSDLIHPQIVVYNSYDTTLGLRIDFGAFKVICSNGLTIGYKVFHYNKKHFASLDIQTVLQGLKESLNQFSEQRELWKTWVDKQLEMEEAKTILSKLELNKKEEREIGLEVEKQSGITLLPWDASQWITKWILFNILAQYITHRVKSITRRFTLENQMRRLF